MAQILKMAMISVILGFYRKRRFKNNFRTFSLKITKIENSLSSAKIYLFLQKACRWCLHTLFVFLGTSVTLRHPYKHDIPEPTQYEHVVRHAELGKQTSFNQDMAKPSPDLHVSFSFVLLDFSYWLSLATFLKKKY